MQCTRCHRDPPDQPSDEFVLWEPTVDGTAVICPGCLTAEEQQAIDEGIRQPADEIEFDEIIKRLN